MRRALGAPRRPAAEDTVALDAGLVDLDVAVFNRLMAAGTPRPSRRPRRSIGAICLPGCGRRGPLEAWLHEARERLRELALVGPARLLGHQRKAGALEDAVRTARQPLALDPLQEPVHRTLMRLYAEHGRRAAALRQYQHCVTMLSESRGGAGGRDEGSSTRRSFASGRPRGPGGGPRASCRKVARAGSSFRWRRPLIGRDAAAGHFATALDRAAASAAAGRRPRGSGYRQDRLMAELIAEAEAARRRGCSLGRAYESEQVLLFGPLVDALRAGRVVQDPECMEALAPPARRASPAAARVGAAGAAPLPARSTTGDSSRCIAQLVGHLAAREPLAARAGGSALGGRAERAAAGVPGRAGCPPSGC